MSHFEREQLRRLCRIFDLLRRELALLEPDQPTMQPRYKVVAA